MISYQIIAQTDRSVEDILEQRRSESEIDDYQNDVLYYYLKHPIKLDEHCRGELEELGILTSMQLRNLEIHIEKYGGIRAMEELMQVEGMDIESIQRIKPFVRPDVDNLRKANTVDKTNEQILRYRWSRNIQKSKAYLSEKIYAGSPDYMNLRYIGLFHTKIETSINLEKDGGEKMSLEKGELDFKSAYISLKKIRKLNQVTVGDFGCAFGQGLTFSSIAGFGKSSEVLLIAKQFNDIKPHRSNSESAFLRGIASNWSFGKVGVITFLSRKNLDATIIEDMVVSIQESGLHRTENEINRKGRLTEEIGGLNLLFKNNDISVGLISVYKNYSKKFREKSDWHKKQGLAKPENLQCGSYFSVEKRNYHLFGEFSKGLNSGIGFYTGFLITLHPGFSSAFSYRNYAVDFNSTFAAGFGEKRENSNEEGIYGAVKYKFRKGRNISVYCDQYRHKYPEFNSVSLSGGIDYVCQLALPLMRDEELLFRLKWEEKEKKEEAQDKPLFEQSNQIKKSLRMQYMKLYNEILRWRFRIEVTTYNAGHLKESGFLIFNELKYKKMMSPWTLLFRFTIFDTDGHNSSIYAYEQGVSGSFSIPSFSGKGCKILFMLKYKWRSKITLSTSLGHIVFDDRKSIGTGYDEIDGSARTSITAQMEYRF